MEKRLRVVLFVLHSCQLLITGSVQGTMVIEPNLGVYHVLQGAKLQLKCSYSGSVDELKWYKDEIDLVSDDTKGLTIRSVTSGGQNHSSLTYQAANSSLSGEYKCKLEGGSLRTTQEERSIQVRVISVQTTDAKIRDGMDAVLECETAQAGVIVVWKKNNNPVETLNVDGNIRYIIHPNGTLQIKNPTLDDVGKYYCTLQISASNQSLEIPVTLYAQLEIRTLESPEILLLHDTLDLTCNVTGYPQASVTWYKDGIEMEHSEGSRYNLSKVEGSLNFTLHIANVSFDDAGNYTCVASISEGVATDIFKTVSVIVQDTMDANFTFKKDALLRCRPSSPGGNVTWFKNGTRVLEPELGSETDTQFIEHENGDLQLKHPTRKAAGVYVCSCVEENNTVVQKNVTLFATPYVLPFQANLSLTEEDRLEVMCQVLGYPSPSITWSKDGKRIDPDNDGRCILSEAKGFSNARLVVESVEAGDAGVYQCLAESHFYPDSTSTKSVVVRIRGKLAPLWPFLGIVAQVAILALIIFISEKRRTRKEMAEDKAPSDMMAEDKAASNMVKAAPPTTSSVHNRARQSRSNQGELHDAVTKL